MKTFSEDHQSSFPAATATAMDAATFLGAAPTTMASGLGVFGARQNRVRPHSLDSIATGATNTQKTLGALDCCLPPPPKMDRRVVARRCRSSLVPWNCPAAADHTRGEKRTQCLCVRVGFKDHSRGDVGCSDVMLVLSSVSVSSVPHCLFTVC